MTELPIRWRLTLWYGIVLAVSLILVSLAAYFRYRAAAWQAFDADLLGSLDGIQGALQEEIQETLAGGVSPSRAAAAEVVSRAAAATLEEFRLGGIDAEIRAGTDAEVALARTGGAATLYDDATWRLLAHTDRTIAAAGENRRCAVRTLPPTRERPPLTLAVARRATTVQTTLASIRRALLAIDGAGVALALLGGYWLATRALRPIDTLTTQAARLAELSATSATHRLEVAHAGDELGRLAETFNRLLERIEADATQRRAFLADAAHELKTPVAIVRAEAELALSHPRTDEAYRESLRVVAAESARLSRLVGDLTLLAEGQSLAHPVQRGLVDLVELVDEVGRSLRPLAAGRGVRIEIQSAGSAEYRGDERLLRQTVTNLIENAVKYSPAGGGVRVAVSEKAGFQEIRVADTAPSLSHEEKASVFERFYRSPRARREDASGSGLGLAIVKWAVRLHGGRVRVETSAPTGNTFVVELPRATPEAP